MNYDTISRKQMLTLLNFFEITHDALICHRDGSFTLRQGYAPGDYQDAQRRMIQVVDTLTRMTKALVVHMQHTHDARDPHLELRFGFVDSAAPRFAEGAQVRVNDQPPARWAYLTGRSGIVHDFVPIPENYLVRLDGQDAPMWLDAEWLDQME